MNLLVLFLAASTVFIAALGLFCCFLLIKYLKLTIEHKNLKNCLKKITHAINSARYGNLYTRIEQIPDNTPINELSKNLNNLFESILDRDVMINEYVEKEKENANLKEDFIATLTHDLKVPIIAQDNTFDLLLNEKFGALNNLQTEAISKLKISNMDLKYLVEALLETYKVEHSGIIIKKDTDIPLNKFIKDIIEQLSSIFELHHKNIDFKTEFEDNYCVNIDLFLVKRVINNLILNALSYSTNSNKIDIILAPSKNQKNSFSISIRDYGIGIEKEELDKIFNKYYTGKLRLTKSSTGLGLYLSNKIITAMQGTITVESKKNEGSTFIVTLSKK